MKKKLAWCLLLPLPFVACTRPGPVAEKKADIIQLEKVTRNTDLRAEHPGVKFLEGSFTGFDFKDERFMQLYGFPIASLQVSIDESREHIKRLSMDLPKSKEAVNALKEQFNKTYGQPGRDSTHDFSFDEEEEMLVWKNDSLMIGMHTDPGFSTATKIENAPTLSILFVEP